MPFYYSFHNTLYYLASTKLSLIVENHGKYAMLQLFQGTRFIQVPGCVLHDGSLGNSQVPARTPESAMQLEDAVPKFLVMPHKCSTGSPGKDNTTVPG